MNDIQAWLNGVNEGQEWPDIYKHAPTYLSRAHRIITHIKTRNEILRLGQRMTDHTPTTEQVRDGYRYDPEDDYYNPLQAGANAERNGRDFDRWLDQTLREAKAEAWDEGKRDGLRQSDWEHGDTATQYIATNPYRQERNA